MAGAQRIAVGVDLGGTKIQTVALHGRQRVGSARVATPQSGVADEVIAAIVQTIHEVLYQAGRSSDTGDSGTVGLETVGSSAIDIGTVDRGAVSLGRIGPENISAIGIGSPGEIDIATGVVTQAANVPGFGGSVRLGPQVAQALGADVPVRIDNDVRVGVLGEHRAGAGRPYANMLGVWLGTGVGGGLILDGMLHEGRGAAGEIGHVVVKPGGRRCGCGRRGCLEAYAGRARMQRRAEKLVKRGERTELFSIMHKKGRTRLTSGVFHQALAHGDEMAVQLIEDASWALALALASVQNLLDLDAIVVGGGLGDKLGQPFIDGVVAQMQPHLFADDHPPVVLGSALGDLSGAVGAALLATEVHGLHAA